MLAATRHTRLICAVETLARATFTDVLPSGEGWACQIANLQKEFNSLLRLEATRFEALKSDLNLWRQQVSSGEAEFDPAREDDLKGALRALIELESFLIDKWDLYRAKELILVKPRLLGLLSTHRQTASKILEGWKSPEWETDDQKVVKWDAEQSEYLGKKLASCE